MPSANGNGRKLCCPVTPVGVSALHKKCQEPGPKICVGTALTLIIARFHVWSGSVISLDSITFFSMQMLLISSFRNAQKLLDTVVAVTTNWTVSRLEMLHCRLSQCMFRHRMEYNKTKLLQVSGLCSHRIEVVLLLTLWTRQLYLTTWNDLY